MKQTGKAESVKNTMTAQLLSAGLALAAILALAGAAATFAACEGPAGPQGSPGTDGADGQAGLNGQPALIPLNLDGLWIFLDDQTHMLDRASTAIKFQNEFINIASISSGQSLINDLKTKGSFVIIIEDAPAYSTGYNFRIIDQNSFAMRYEYVSNPTGLYFALLAALTDLKGARDLQ
jgi:hypothetical protein